MSALLKMSKIQIIMVCKIIINIKIYINCILIVY